jgi:dolichyl-phosphate beta-glucosyltransferase
MLQPGGSRSSSPIATDRRTGWPSAEAEPGTAPELELVRPGRRPTKAKLDLVVPALNEEARIGATLEALADRFRAESWTESIRVTVVDNGSVDATAEAVDRARQANIDVQVIGCQTRGKGAAVRAGVLFAAAPYVGYCDADQSTPTSAVGQALHLLDAGWDVVIGSRRCLGAGYAVRQPTLRRAGSAAFHAVAARLAPAASDTQCGFKMFRTEVAQALFTEGVLDGFAFDVELLARAGRHRDLAMIELPIHWSDQPGSTFRPVTDGLRSFNELREVRRALRSSPRADRMAS